MQIRRFTGVLSVLACAGIAAGDDAIDLGSSYTCTVNGFQWLGFSEDFFALSNWDTCLGIPAPQTGLGLYFGHQRVLINGIFAGWTASLGPCVLGSNYSNPSLRMLSGDEISFTIQNAVYTCPTGEIGLAPISGYPNQSGSATLILDNAIWDGSLQISEPGGSGVLKIVGQSEVTGSVSIRDGGSVVLCGQGVGIGGLGLSFSPGAGGTATIRNEGSVLIDQAITGSPGALWQNLVGSEVSIEQDSFRAAQTFPTLLTGTFVNNQGASIRKLGNTSASISWFFTNDGTVIVEDGTLSINGRSSGSGSFSVLSGRLTLSGTYLGDYQINAEPGAVTIFGADVESPQGISFNGDVTLPDAVMTDDLTISGEYQIIRVGTSIQSAAPRIVNTGDATLDTTIRATRYGTDSSFSRWQNAPGSTLTLKSGGLSENSGTGNPSSVVFNQEGAEIRKIGKDSVSISWDQFINDGNVIVEEGTLSIISNFSNRMTGTIAGNGELQLRNAAQNNFSNEGTIAPTPGETPLILSEIIRVTQQPDAVFKTSIGSLHGQLSCPAISLNGTLDLQRLGDFEPNGTEQIVIVSANDISGVFANATPHPGKSTAFDVRTGELEYDVVYSSSEVIVQNISIVVPPCNPADLAPPGGLLDLADITAFVTAFTNNDDAADLAEPTGLLDLADIVEFLNAFLAGCP